MAQRSVGDRSGRRRTVRRSRPRVLAASAPRRTGPLAVVEKPPLVEGQRWKRGEPRKRTPSQARRAGRGSLRVQPAVGGMHLRRQQADHKGDNASVEGERPYAVDHIHQGEHKDRVEKAEDGHTTQHDSHQLPPREGIGSPSAMPLATPCDTPVSTSGPCPPRAPEGSSGRPARARRCAASVRAATDGGEVGEESQGVGAIDAPAGETPTPALDDRGDAMGSPLAW